MKPALFFLFLTISASPAWAAPSVSPDLDPVAHAISEVLREQGFEETKAAALAQRIVDRLLAEAAAPKLQEKEPSPLPAEWNDALAAERKAADEKAAAIALVAGREKAYPENVANFVVEETDEASRLVILKHLREIEDTERMSESIATDGYWRQVFNDQGYGDVYDASRDLLKKALRAGLKPYKEGKGLNAKLFARLAAQAIAPPEPLASVPAALIAP